MSGLKTCDDTEEVEFKMWGPVQDDEWANKDLDGAYIICRLCVGNNKGSNRSHGKIKARRKFDKSHWNDHCQTQTHLDCLANQEAMKRSKDPAQNRKQKSLTTFFSVKPKKSAEDTATVVAEASSATTTAPVVAGAVTNSTVPNDPDR